MLAKIIAVSPKWIRYGIALSNLELAISVVFVAEEGRIA
jgi:hypothetical protein